MLALLLLLTVPASAGPGEAARAASALVAEKPAGAEALFDKAFFRHISLEKLNGIFAGLWREHGPVREVVLASSGAASGHYFFDTERGWRIPVALSVAEGGGISGIFFSPPYRKDATLAGVKKELEALPGSKGLLVRRLGPAPETLESLAADEAFAVGSVFKLYVLGAMLKERTPWEKVYRLREEAKSLPSGRLQAWPDGSPLTAHTLAALMISESDNTATDLLVDAVGRKKIEGHLAALGHSDPARLRPFLRTADMFRLKSSAETSLKYLNLPEAERYAFLDALRAEPLAAEKVPANPFGIDRLEWHASPADVCRLLEFLQAQGGSRALEILALNPGLPAARERFRYAGYKGGSEPGVLSMAWLLKSRRDEWYCLAASWNDPAHALDEKAFFSLMQGAINALAGGVEGTKAP